MPYPNDKLEDGKDTLLLNFKQHGPDLCSSSEEAIPGLDKRARDTLSLWTKRSADKNVQIKFDLTQSTLSKLKPLLLHLSLSKVSRLFECRQAHILLEKKVYLKCKQFFVILFSLRKAAEAMKMLSEPAADTYSPWKTDRSI